MGNPVNSLDADRDGLVSAVDVPIRINRINVQGVAKLPVPVIRPRGPEFYYDVNGDDAITALDVLMVIHYINSLPLGVPQGESSATPFAAAAPATNTGSAGTSPSVAPQSGVVQAARGGVPVLPSVTVGSG